MAQEAENDRGCKVLGESLDGSKRGNMDIKKWVGVATIIVVLGSTIVWMRAASEVNGREVQVTQLKSKLPPPTSGQKKVVLKNLGMS